MKLVAYIRFGFIFLIELVKSSLAVSRAILVGDRKMRSAVVAVPIDLTNVADAAMVANAVTLTPGTTSLHLSDDGRKLYVHVMDWRGDEDVIDTIKGRFERVLKEAA